MDKEKKRHDLAIEKYQKDYNTWKQEQEKRELWMEEQEKREENANKKFQSTVEDFRKYSETHPEDNNNDLEEPDFHDYYSPSKNQKNGELYSQFYQLQD